ncbi:exodeoxyribonuclease VII small subunit [Uliginosibacterium sp. H1]|uniref:exodeoxyribonuclease VII small subunit n=1 Tax=Uliginosibacterium sp. H1 TaxID=3114757 RepID=UPI002E16D5CC|nr:exodeoxyribonuclease VII small subunit [Uliginosibacterium sp. H1]
MPKAAPASTEPSFEEALAELERIVADMEAGELPLEESLQRYQRGVALLRQCQGRLDVAEQRIRVLEQDQMVDTEIPLSRGESA